MSSRAGLVACAAVLVAVTVSGCAIRLPFLPSSDGEPPPPPDRPTRVQGPPDRDPAAVLPALRRLDACALLDVDLARSRGNPDAALTATGPHSCALTGTPQTEFDPSLEGIGLQVGAAFGTPDRYSSAPVVLAGVRAYQNAGTAGENRCDIAIPVSHELAVRLSYTSPATPACTALRGYAESTARRLLDPGRVAAPTVPYARWDGCFLLAAALGPDAGRYRYHAGGTSDDEFAGCGTDLVESDGGRSTTPGLEVEFDQPPGSAGSDADGTVTQVGGREVRSRESAGRCELSWSPRPSGVNNESLTAVVFSLTMGDCVSGTRTAEQIMTLAEQEPPSSPAAVQRPLVYRPSEPDSGLVGACVDFAAADDDCAPADLEMPVPPTADEVLESGDRSRDLGCVLFQDAVHGRIASDLTPVVWGKHCVFVRPAHDLTLTVDVSSTFPPDDYGRGADLYTDRRVVDVGGRPAVTFFDSSRHSYDVYASPHGDPTRPGMVHLQVERSAPRGSGGGRFDGPPIDAALQAKVTSAAADVVSRYFAG